MLMIAAFRGGHTQVVQFGFAYCAAKHFKGPKTVEILEYNFDGFLIFPSRRFMGVFVPLEGGVDDLSGLLGNIGSAVEGLGHGG